MDKKLLRWNFIFQYGYVLTNIFNSIILLPLYLKYIDANTLGIWLATGSILSWMILTDPGVGEVLQQKIAELRGKNLTKEVGDTIGSGIIASAIILVLSVILGFIFYFLLEFIINKDVSQYGNLKMALVISIVATGMSLVSFSLSGINQGLHNSANVAISSMSANVLFLICNVVLLLFGFGVMSIAFANLGRALFINGYNLLSMLQVLKKDHVSINYSKKHFKSFIKIFSFTSASKILTGLSQSLDMIILARFIPASMITVYEINRRPINMTQGLIGRHSVALMPLISHAKGLGDQKGIIQFINKQFKIYMYAAVFTTIMFWLVYSNLISLWTGRAQYAGNTIVYLLLVNYFFALIGYFMSNMGYALGDIKMNSFINIVKGIAIAVLLIIVAKTYGIIGTILVWITVTISIDFIFFSYRLIKLGYLTRYLIRNTVQLLAIILPVGFAIGWLIKLASGYLFADDAYLLKLLLNGATFTLFFLLMILIIDQDFRDTAKGLKDKFFLSSFYKTIRA